MRNSILSISVGILALFIFPAISGLQCKLLEIRNPPYQLYPETNKDKPDIASPLLDGSGRQWVVALTKEHQYAVMDVSLNNDKSICKQLVVDTLDFPDLVQTGLHDRKTLNNLKTVTGRTVDEITRLGQPGQLSQGGFMAAGEDLISVLLGDDELVRKMGLTHPQLAEPLFHVLNMMDHDLDLNRWNMAKHEWENVQKFYYNGKTVNVKAYDTKGGQLSIFDDQLQGAFHIQLWRDLTPKERSFLYNTYGHLSGKDFETLINRLSFINTGELQPQYIMRYGFYEGHTFWRTDPIAIAYIFGLRSLEEIEEASPGKLFEVLTNHFSNSGSQDNN